MRWYLVVRVLGDTRPCLLVGSAKHTEDAEQLIDLAVTREDGAVVEHFDEDAAHGPNVDGASILSSSEKNLRCAIPKSHDLDRVTETEYTLFSHIPRACMHG